MICTASGWAVLQRWTDFGWHILWRRQENGEKHGHILRYWLGERNSWYLIHHCGCKIELSMLIQLSRSSSVQVNLPALYYLAASGTYMNHGMQHIFHKRKKKIFFFVSGITSDLTLGFLHHSDVQYLNSILKKTQTTKQWHCSLLEAKCLKASPGQQSS